MAKVNNKHLLSLKDRYGVEIITSKVIKERRIFIINKYFNGNIRRLLRSFYKSYRKPLVYSKGLKKMDLELKEYLLSLNAWPRNISIIYNIYNILITKYNYKNNKLTIELAYYVFMYFEEDIEEYTKTRFSKGVLVNGHKNTLTPKEALREQKARGFIHINYFEDYKTTHAHVYSTVDPDYVWPQNFWHNNKHREPEEIMSYHGHYLVGVPGFTKVVVPGNN